MPTVTITDKLTGDSHNRPLDHNLLLTIAMFTPWMPAEIELKLERGEILQTFSRTYKIQQEKEK